jgi:micrococcal nuclease
VVKNKANTCVEGCEMHTRHPVENLVKLYIILMAVLFLLPTISSAGQFKVTGVPDGETVNAQGHDTVIKVRLVGIDAPETSENKNVPGQPYSQKAREHLAELVLNKTVDIKDYGMGPLNSVLGVIYLNGKNINLEMVKAGLAEVYRGRAPHKFPLIPYWQAEKEARDDLRGMWILGDEYVSPKTWRKMQKEK